MRDLVFVAISCIVCLLVVGLLFWYFGVSWEMFRIETIDSAHEIAKSQIAYIIDTVNTSPPALLVLLVFKLCKMPSFLIFLIAGVLTFIALVGAVRMRKFETVVLSVFAAASLGIFLIFTALTNNQPGSGLALLALSLLLDFATLVQIVAARRVYLLAVLPLIIALTIQIGWTSTRYLNDFDQASLGSSVDGAVISPQLAHLRWAIPSDHPGERIATHYREL